MVEPNWQALNQFMAQPEPTAPRFVIRAIKLPLPYCPPGTSIDSALKYVYCILDTLTGEFLQAVECYDTADNPDLVKLCALLNGV